MTIQYYTVEVVVSRTGTRTVKNPSSEYKAPATVELPFSEEVVSLKFTVDGALSDSIARIITTNVESVLGVQK